MAFGRIYFVQALDGGPIKIGFARDVTSRLKSLQTNSPMKLGCLVHICGSTEEEHLLHQDFAQWRLEGEWFQDCPEIQELVGWAKSHITAEALGSEPPKERRPRAKPERMSDFQVAMFRLMAIEAFGRAGLAQKIADAAGVTEKAAQNWLCGKSDPGFDSLINLSRAEPKMHLWFMANVVSGIVSQQKCCTEEEAYSALAQFPEIVAGICICGDKNKQRAAIEALWSCTKGKPVAATLEFIDQFCAEAAANYQARIAEAA